MCLARLVVGCLLQAQQVLLPVGRSHQALVAEGNKERAGAGQGEAWPETPYGRHLGSGTAPETPYGRDLGSETGKRP